MKYLGFLFNMVSGSFSIFSFIKKVLLEKTLIIENKKICEINKTGALFLIWWAIGNMIIGALMIFFSYGKLLYFFEMNIMWNIVNLIVGFISLRNSEKASIEEHKTVWDFLEMISGTEKLLIFNTGLDIAFLVLGFYLIDKGFSTTSNMLVGFGASVFFQALVLIVFDSVLYLLNRYSSNEVLAVLKEGDKE